MLERVTRLLDYGACTARYTTCEDDLADDGKLVGDRPGSLGLYVGPSPSPFDRACRNVCLLPPPRGGLGQEEDEDLDVG